MYLDLEVSEHLVISGITDHLTFLLALPHLLTAQDTLVFGTYGSRADVATFLSARQISPDAFVTHAREAFAIHQDTYPQATAFAVRPEPSLLRDLVTLLGPESTYADLCDHIVAYGHAFPIFSYHDAFRSPLYITSRLAAGRVAAFTTALGGDVITEAAVPSRT